MAEDTTNALQVAEKGKLEVEHPHSIDSVPTSVDGKVEENGEAEVEEIGDEGVLPTGYVDQSRVLPRKELVLVFVALMIVIFLASLDQTIVSVLIPALGKAFNAPQYIAWVGTSYLLTNTATQPLYGKLSDIFGRKNTIISAILLFLVGSLICGAAPSMNVLIFGRALSGSGAGGMISLTLIIISDVVSMRDRGAFMGAIFYCPLYFQMVKHYNATKAGIHLLPMVAGMLVGGIGGGIAVSKTGRYRPFIWGALIIYTTGIALLSLWDESSGLGIQIGFLFLVGLGLGGCMQNIVLAGQCAVSQADIATVTSLMSFFRSMGGVVCVAIGGSLINNILTQNGVDPNNFAVIYTHPEIYAKATQAIFRQCIAWPVLAFISSLLLKHHVLRKTLREETAGEA
ncbi:hypothetical protein BGZ90_005480 [Linnemannia elongata]|nr:hypothetical protein BGZ90_005480 [Linnemannia elongata]